MKQLRYYLEAFFTLLAYGLLRSLPLAAASAFGGWIARSIGPLTRVHQVALQNLSRAMPELSEDERRIIALRMWDNLGRVFAEYPHLASDAMKKSIRTVQGLEYFEWAKQSDRPAIFISGHIGNWELLPVSSAGQDLKMHLLYRPANNPVVNRLVARMREPYSLGLHAKGSASARGIIRALRNKEPAGMLVDQKTNDGIPVPFFGHDAMTTDAIAHFVQHYNAAIIPVFCRRVKGAQFDIFVSPPMEFEQPDDSRAVMTHINQLIEAWVREDPGQWFWVHKRWPKG